MQMADEQMRTEEMPTESKAEEITDPQSTDELLTLCKGDRELALDVAMDELNRAQQSKGKGANAAETMAINQRIRTYQRMVDDLSKVEETPTEIPTEQTTDTQVTDDMEFIYQKDLGENHEGMEPMQLADGRYKWVGLQRGELTATMGERDTELLDGLAKKLGVAIIPIDVADSAVNGYYRDGNIYVNTNRGAEWTMRWVAGHEMLHDVAKKSPEAYDAYKQAVLNMWDSGYIDNQVKQIIDDYAASGKTINREQALTELVNDFGGELFSSRDGLKILDNILKDESRKGNTGFVNTIKQWWERLKEWFGGTPYASEVGKKLADAYKEAIANAEKFGKNLDAENNIVRNLKERPAEVTNDDLIANEGAEMSIVRDRNKIEELEGEELVPMLRTFQILDGALYSPMATIQRGKKVHSVVEGDWWKADENPDLAQVKVKGSSTEFYDKDDDRISKKDGKWVITIDGEDKPLATNGNSLSYYFNLKKGEKGDVVTDDLYAAYNPYIHASRSALNDQFKGAYLRPNLVLAEVLVPKSELDGTNRYKADYAKDGIGEVDWNSGTVIKQAVAAGHPGRKVALSRYAKIGKVFTNAEWADKIDEELSAYKAQITLPFIAFPPDVLRELANRGYKVEPPTSKKAQPYYEAWLKGEEPTNPNSGKPSTEFSIKADKQKQLDIISSINPMRDDYHTGIRKVDDILTLQEAIEASKQENGEGIISTYPDVDESVYNEALQSGKIKVYSSKPIENGAFVGPSMMQAKDYAGGGKVYSKEVNVSDIAWINADEGVFAPTEYSVKGKRADESVLDYAKRMAEEERKNSLLADTEDVSRDEQIVYGNTDADYSIKIGGKEYENDGYTQREDGTNLSVRALDAEEDGSFSRGNFVKAYKVAKKDFDLLQSLGVIKNTEWHHTGNNFRETDFFTWVDSTRNGGNASYSDLTELEPESIGAKYKANKKEIGALIGEYEKHEWGSLPKYKKPMPTLENFTDDYIKKHAVKELSSNWLTIEDINQKNIEQNEISKNRELYSPYERFQQHKLVDAKYEDRAEIRKKEWIEAHKEEIQEQYNALKAEIDKYNSNIASHAEVYANDAKGKYLMEILDLLGYSAEDAAKMVNKVHHRYNYLQRTNRAEQAREAVNREYAQKEAVMRQDFDKWFNKSIKDGKAAYVERLPNKPEFFITKKVEMNGKYGWFEASSRYNLPVYYSGYQFGSKRLYDSYIKRQSDIVKVRDEGIVKAADAYNKAIFDAESNTYFSVKGKRADESVLDYAKRMSEETGKKNLLNGGSYFSGGGLLEEGLKGIVNPTIAVEFNQKVAGVYRNNFGEHIVTADVRNVDPASLVKNIDGPVAYFHASPVCKNFSKAKQSAEELPLDKATAQSTAEFISKVRPKIVTIENVKGYRDSESMKIILDELKKQGYNYDVDVYNAADYGAYTSRERLIVRAVRDWSLPAKPMVMLADDRPSGWLEAVADIIDTLPEKKSGVAKWMDERLMAMGIDYRNINKPLYVFGSGYSKDRIGYAFADELVPTLRTKGGDVIVMPDGRVLKATPRVLARISGMSDEYEMPKTDDLAHTIVGNGIPVQLTKAVMGSLIENVKSDLDAGNTEYSIIGKRGAANLDKRDETSIRVDNMVTAEEMEKAGKDAKTIRMATGWERGADGKWRYEVKDLSMLPAEQWIGKRNKKLSDIVENADELFAAYPELANVKIKEGNGKTYGGMYSDGTITLDTYLAKLWMKRLPDSLPRANKFMNETLIHEIQHYIQEKEGFAAGGNEGMILNKDAISEIDALISDSNKLAVQYNDMIAKGVYEGREEIKEKIISLRAKANAIKKKNVIGAEGYRSLAGEVEARNAEFRSNMTDKERANTMLADTEDVAREDQIFLPDDLSDYSIKQPKDVEYEAKEQWRKENAAAITSSFFAERRLDKADKIQKLKDEINKLIKETRATNKENSEKVKEIAKEMQTYIKENIPTETQGDMTRPQFEQVIKQLSTAITRKDLEKPMRMVEYIGANTNRRALTRQMRDFLKQGFKGMTPKGLVKAKNVDGATSRVLGLAKSLYESMGKQPLGSDLRALQTKVRGIKAELEDLNNANGGAFSEYIEQINAILKKSGVDRYEEMTKYYNELSDRQDVGEIQVSELLDHINRMLPELFSIELIKEQRTQAKADSAMATKEDLEQLRNNLEDKREKGILSEEDQAVLDNMAMYELMVNLQQRQLDIDGPGTSSIASQMAAKVREAKQYRDELEKYDDKQSGVAKNLKDNIKRVNAEMEELFVQRTQAQKEVNANVAELLDNLKQLRDTGNSALKEWSKNKQERETRIVTMANASFGKDARGYWSEVDRRGGWKRDFSNRMNNLRLAALMSPALSFEYMVGVMDPRFYTNESPIYKQFIKGEDGLIKANDNFFEGLEAYNNGINEAVERFINRNAMQSLKEYFNKGDRFATEIIPFEFEVKENVNGEVVTSIVHRDAEMTRGRAAKIYAWSRMADGMAKLKAHGVTDETLEVVKAFIGQDYMDFIDWVEDEYFPKLRREKYNPIYKQMYGISMAENEHYFPFETYKKDIRTEKELEQINSDNLGGGIVGNIIERKRNNARLDFTDESPDIFDAISEYGRKMEEWAAYAQVREDLKKVINNKQFKQHCDMLGTNYYNHFLDAARVASRLYNPQPSAPQLQSAAAKLQKVFASAAISLRVSTALKQLLSAPAFAVYSLDPAFHKELLKTTSVIDVESAIKGLRELANGNKAEAKRLLLEENWVGHYNWCVNNLPSFRERVSKGGAGNPILEEKGWSKFSDDVQSVGMLPNRLVDAFTCSVGAKAIYEYAFNKYKKTYDEATAHNMAVTDAEIAFNSSQQSSNPVFLSPLQSSKEFWLRGIMNYKNSPIGYYRNGMKANIDLYRATKALFGKPKFTINGEQVGFESNGTNPAAKAAEAAAKSIMFNFFLNYLWAFGTIGIAGVSYTMMNNDDKDGNMLYTDEEFDKATGGNMGLAVFNAATQGIPWVSGFASVSQTGQDYTPSILFSEMNNYLEQVNKEGFMSLATAQLLIDLGLKNAVGVDPEVWGQIYRGAQGIMADRPMRTEDFMNLLASPRSAIAGVAKQKVGEYGNMQDYVNARIESEREIGINETMDLGKKLNGLRTLRKSKLDGYIDEYLADKIPDYRELANKPDEKTKEERMEESNAFKNLNTLISTVRYTEEKKKSSKKIDGNEETKDKVKKIRKAVNVIHKLYTSGDASSAQRIADELERRLKRGYNENGVTLDDKLKNVDIYDSTGTTEQRGTDGFDTMFDRAMLGGFDGVYLGSKLD